MKKKHDFEKLAFFLVRRSGVSNVIPIILFIFMCTVSQLWAGSSYAQMAKVSISERNASIRTILDKIEAQTDYSFTYDASVVDVNRRIDVQLRDIAVSEALDQVFKGTGINYQIENNQIVLNRSTIPSDSKGSQQQQTKISGTVRDQFGEPVLGATVVEKGTINGTTTNIDGQFSLSVRSTSKVLVVSFIGMETQEVPITGASMTVVLREGTQSLDEVIAIGYGTARRKDITGATTMIKGEELTKIPVTNAAEAISGRLAGVQVTTADGSPDAEVLIRVRGGSSITGSNKPLIIVDGFPVDNLGDISVNDIEDLVVLKDAVSTAIYGSKGANGVLLVTTKSAKSGKTVVSYNGFLKASRLARKLKTLNSYQYVLFQYERLALGGEDGIKSFEDNFGVYEDIDLYQHVETFDGQEDLFGKSTFSRQHNISVMGGSDQTKFALSGIYDNNAGLMVSDGYERFYVNFKLDHKISDNLKFNMNIRVTDTQIDGSGTSGDTYKYRTSDAIKQQPTKGLFDFAVVDLSEMSDEEREDYLNTVMTPSERAAQTWKQQEKRSFQLAAGLEWHIMKNLVYKLDGGFNYGFNEIKRYWGYITTKASYVFGEPLIDWTKQNTTRMRMAQTLTYNQKFGNHSVNAMAGQEIINSGNNSNYMYGVKYSRDLTPEKIFANLGLSSSSLTISSYVAPDDRLLSYFGRVGYSYAEKYLVSFTIRADGSSKFKKGNRWGYFPAGAFGWRVSEEEFMYSTRDVLSNLKLRLSFGASGNNDIANMLYQLTYDISEGKRYGLGDEPSNNYEATNPQMANPNLRWETSLTRNLGLDFGLWNGRVSGTIDAYYNSTDDLLIVHDIVAPGYAKIYENIGAISSKGIELTLDAVIINKKDFSLSANFNIAHNKEVVKRLSEGITEMEFASGWAGTDLKGYNDYRVIVGESTGIMYGWETDGYYTTDDFESYDPVTKKYILKDGVPTTGLLGGSIGIRPGTLKLKNQTGGDNVVDDADRVILGNAIPKLQGGFGFSSRIKNFDVSMLLSYVYGNDIYNATKLATASSYRSALGNLLGIMNLDNSYSYLDRSTGTIVTDLETLKAMNEGENAKQYWSAHSTGNAVSLLHSWAVEDGSFLRFQNVQIGYTLPSKLTRKAGCEKFRIYGTLNNIYCWTNYSGYDPEVSSPVREESTSNLTKGVDYSAYPKSFSWILGVNVSF